MICRSRRAQRALGLALAAAVLLTAACSGDDTGDEDAATDETVEPEAEGPAEPVPSPGCEAPPAAPEVEAEHTLTVDAVPRRYLRTVPTSYDGETPVPLVFDIHGLAEGAEIHAGMTKYSDLAEEEDFVVAFPHGTGQPVQWTIDQSPTNPDLLYFDALREELGAELCIDEARVYLTGLSMGAWFSSLLLCERADVFAAAAPVAGLLSLEDCDTTQPVPVVSYHGTEDPILLFNGGVDTSRISGLLPEGEGESTTTTAPPEPDLDGEGYPANVAAFAERNGCDPEPEDEELTEAVVHRVYDCPEGTDVEFYIVLGGGHSWPSSEFSQSVETIVGPTTFDIDATRDSWEFLHQFTNGGGAGG